MAQRIAYPSMESGAPAREVHIILDNLTAHKSQVVRSFLATHPNVHFHFTSTYSSSLNQFEIWSFKVERDVIARGIFTNVKDLARKLRRYINAYSANAKPIQWRYSDSTRRIRSNVVSATCHWKSWRNADFPSTDCSHWLPRRIQHSLKTGPLKSGERLGRHTFR